jgi:superfamily II DNA or RNA helicase
MPASKKRAVRKTSRRSAAKRPSSRKTTAKRPAPKAARKKTTRRRPARKTAAKRAPAQKALKALRTLSPLPPGQGQWFALNLPPAFPGAWSKYGVVWDQARKAFFWPGLALPDHLRPFGVPLWSWGWHQENDLNGRTSPIPLPSGEPWQPRPHQVVAADHMDAAYDADFPGFVLADDVGVGKTISATTWMKRHGKDLRRILIVSPLSVLPHWRRTLVEMGVQNPDILIINYDQLAKVMENTEGLSTRRKGKLKRVAKQGKAPAYDLIIVDEAHKGKNPLAARSILLRRIGDKARFCLWLTATLGKDALELSYLAPLLGHLTHTTISVDTLQDYGEWCMAQDLGVVKGARGAFRRAKSDDEAEVALAERGTQRLHNLLFKPHKPFPVAALRRVPQDIAGWPEMERQLHPEEVNPESLSALEAVCNEFKREERAAPPPGQRKGKESEHALARQMRLRQAFSKARLDFTVQMTLDLLDNEKQVAISVNFLDSMRAIEERLRAKGIAVETIYGGSPDREAARLRFQRGESTVVLFTPEEGISLHQGEYNKVPRVMLIHDVRWSPIQMAQIEGRCHRDGALAPIYWLFAENSIELTLAQTVMGGVRSMKTLMGDDTQTVRALENQLRAWAMAA